MFKTGVLSPLITSDRASIRTMRDRSIGSVEFIVPAYMREDRRYLEHVCRTKAAKDRHEHTANWEVIGLDSVERDKLVRTLASFLGSGLHLRENDGF